MPSPIAHIFYAQRFLEQRPAKDTAGFFQGTVFPDIRRLGTIPRSKTHHAGFKFEDVLVAESDWRAGWVFHNWLDEYWSNFFYPDLIPGQVEHEVS